MRYAIVRDGIIENIIEWDGEASWEPPDGTQCHEFERTDPDRPISLGWLWNDGSPAPPEGE